MEFDTSRPSASDLHLFSSANQRACDRCSVTAVSLQVVVTAHKLGKVDFAGDAVGASEESLQTGDCPHKLQAHSSSRLRRLDENLAASIQVRGVNSLDDDTYDQQALI